MRTFFISLFCILLPMQSFAYSEQGFQTWLKAVETEALKKGISPNVVQEALGRVEFLPRVIALDGKQPEKKITFAEYRKRILSDTRITRGRKLYKEHADALQRVAQKYGVAPQYIVALWGTETNFGSYTGNFSVINSLATLAYEGRRGKFFRSELFKALEILDQGHIDIETMEGSWAGAMGQNQFMPSSFHRFAVDGNGDGRRDIWTNLDDVFASTANYLAKNGWKPGQKWGREVVLTQAISKDLLSKRMKKPLIFWQKKGVRLANGANLPQDADISATLYCPDGLASNCFLGYDNYRVFLAWNRSTYFASSVGLLADAISR